MQEKILELLEDRKYGEIAALVKDMNPADAAAMLQELPEARMPLVFRLLPKELAAETFAYMEGDAQELLIQGFTDKELDEVMEEMFLDDAVDMIEEMPANVVKKILRHVDADTRKMINQVLNYPKDSAGSIMTMEYVDLKRRMTVEQAFERIRATALDSETVYTCYVTDSRRKLEGVITVRELLMAPKDAVLMDIMETNVKFVTTHTDQEEAARLLSKYDFLALPVVDAEERLVGIVTVDDAIDVIQEETTEDMEMMAAISPSDKPYLKTGVFTTWKQRVPWLLLLMISATFTSTIIASYEGALATTRGAHRVYPHADGYRRQRGEPVLHHGHPRPVPGGDPLPGRAPAGGEGAVRGGAVRPEPGRRQLHQADAGGPGDAACWRRWSA